MPEQTLLVHYHGDVQGVGFRATARRLSADFNLKGWVKNEADGSVGMIVSGDRAQVEAFLKAIRESRLGAHIEREVVEPQPDGMRFTGFDIRH